MGKIFKALEKADNKVRSEKKSALNEDEAMVRNDSESRDRKPSDAISQPGSDS